MFGDLVNLAISWVVLTVAFLAAAAIVPGFEIKDAKSGFWVAALFAVVNVLVSWLFKVVFGVVTLGIACLLPGLMSFLVTVALIKLVAALTNALKVKGLFPAALAAVVMSLVHAALEYGLEHI
jgi:putative membrane protein